MQTLKWIGEKSTLNQSGRNTSSLAGRSFVHLMSKIEIAHLNINGFKIITGKFASKAGDICEKEDQLWKNVKFEALKVFRTFCLKVDFSQSTFTYTISGTQFQKENVSYDVLRK